MYNSLDDIGKDWKGKIGPLQKWWIGKPVGTRVNLTLLKRYAGFGKKLLNVRFICYLRFFVKTHPRHFVKGTFFISDGAEDGEITVHVARPEALFGAAFLVLSSSNFDVVKRNGKGTLKQWVDT